MRSLPLGLLLSSAAACGSDGTTDPTDVPFGTTAIVVVVNPVVNDANLAEVPAPGTVRSGVRLTTDDGASATTGADGIAILAPVAAGTRTVTVAGAVDGGTFTVNAVDGALREVALATDSGRAELMVNVDYKADAAVEVDPSMSIAEVNAALAVSDTVVFFAGGHYQGDLDFSGSRVTLFGEGVLGGNVVLDGDITVSGSDSRIRGASITGALTIPASKVGLAFSTVDGTVSSEGSDGMFLANSLCGQETITGSGTVVLGNVGASPAAPCP